MQTNERNKFVQELQESWLPIWLKVFKGQGIAQVGTGVGKTKFAIMCIDRILSKRPEKRVVISVPKVDLIDNWWEQIQRWGTLEQEYYKENIKIETHAATYKRKDELFEFLIVDEVHNIIADNYIKIISENTLQYFIGLSATLTKEKEDKLKTLNLFTFANYDIDKAADDEVTAKSYKFNYRVSLSEVEQKEYDAWSSILTKIRADHEDLDPKKLKYVLAGTYILKNCRTTLQGKELSLRVALKYQKAIHERKRIVFMASEKAEALVDICDYIQSLDGQVIVFGEFKEALIMFKTALDLQDISNQIYVGDLDRKEQKKIVEDFKNGKFTVLLTAKKFNEGIDMPDIEWGIEVGGNSSIIQSPQRIGRIIRFKQGKVGKFIHITCGNTIEQGWIVGAYSKLKYKPRIINKPSINLINYINENIR